MERLIYKRGRMGKKKVGNEVKKFLFAPPLMALVGAHQ
jgi:hypothetical protein